MNRGQLEISLAPRQQMMGSKGFFSLMSLFSPSKPNQDLAEVLSTLMSRHDQKETSSRTNARSLYKPGLCCMQEAEERMRGRGRSSSVSAMQEATNPMHRARSTQVQIPRRQRKDYCHSRRETRTQRQVSALARQRGQQEPH